LLAICYVWFSMISVKEPRYALLLLPICLLIAATGAAAMMEKMRSVSWQMSYAVLATIMLLHVPLAAAVNVRRISGFEEVVAYVNRVAPVGWVFYSGDYHGIFTYYLRANDHAFSRGVVRSGKLLYVTMIDHRLGLQENVKSSGDVVRILRERCGCRYLVVEREPPKEIQAEVYMRNALRSGDFRLVHSFRVETPTVHDIDLYELLNAREQPREFDLAFPELGDGVHYRTEPIQR